MRTVRSRRGCGSESDSQVSVRAVRRGTDVLRGFEVGFSSSATLM
jgi:hypothetical protein